MLCCSRLPVLASGNDLLRGKKQLNDMNEEELEATVVYEQKFGLVLKPTGAEVDEYRRVGMVKISSDLAEGWERQEITII